MKIEVGKTYKVISGGNGYDKGEVFTVTGNWRGVLDIQMDDGRKYSEICEHMDYVLVAEVTTDEAGVTE